MKKSAYIVFVLFIFSCGDKEDFTRASGGMEYKIVQRDVSGVPVLPGQYLKLSVVQRYGDTVLIDAAKTGYQYQLVDSLRMSPASWLLFHDACLNDSIVFRVPADSAFHKKKPAFVKKKDWLITTVKVAGILSNADSVDADRYRERERMQQRLY